MVRRTFWKKGKLFIKDKYDKVTAKIVDFIRLHPLPNESSPMAGKRKIYLHTG